MAVCPEGNAAVVAVEAVSKLRAATSEALNATLYILTWSIEPSKT